MGPASQTFQNPPPGGTFSRLPTLRKTVHAPTAATYLARPPYRRPPAGLLCDLSRARPGKRMEAPVRWHLDVGLARLPEGGNAKGLGHRGWSADQDGHRRGHHLQGDVRRL